MSHSNHMMCDLETGVCGVGEEAPIQSIDFNQPLKKITLYYATDPICSHCWALEPVLNRFIRQYGQYVHVKIVMGGLLANWSGFADKANGIQQPSDVAQHWKEVGAHSRMPIDGSLWHSNPIQSSYPPSRVFKVMETLHSGKEHEFLRRAREAVFVFNQNIGEDDTLVQIVDRMGLNGAHVVEAAGLHAAQDLLEQDFQLASSLGVRGFPTVILINEENKGVKLVGARSLDSYVDALQQLSNQTSSPVAVPPLAQLLEEEQLLFSKEMEVMYDIEQNGVEAFVQSELAAGSYRVNRILDETYVTTTHIAQP